MLMVTYVYYPRIGRIVSNLGRTMWVACCKYYLVLANFVICAYGRSEGCIGNTTGSSGSEANFDVAT